MSMIDEIKTALSDPSCESVDVLWEDYTGDERLMQVYVIGQLDYFKEHDSNNGYIKSFAVNEITETVY